MANIPGLPATVKEFIQKTAQTSNLMGIKSVIVLVRDPQTGEIGGYNTTGAWQDMAEFVTEKLGLKDAALGASEAEWPGG